MSNAQLHIKNMVCPRCVQAVEQILTDLNIAFSTVGLGVVDLEAGAVYDKLLLTETLQARGFALLLNKEDQIIDAIKSSVLDLIRYKETDTVKKNSVYLSEKLGHSYSFLSRLFSKHEGVTIEKYIILQKIERVKELLSYNELTLSQIASKMGYSSVQHLSGQFRTVTGQSVSKYRGQTNLDRNFLDKV